MSPVRTASVLALAVLVAGCSSQPSILDATASGDGRTLEVQVDQCGGQYAVVISERADRVQVSITRANGQSLLEGDDCSDTVRPIRLDSPLGGRALIDGASGRVIPVRYMPWNQWAYSEAEYAAGVAAAAECIEESGLGATASVQAHPDGYSVLAVDWPDLGEDRSRIEVAAQECIALHIDPLRT